MNTGFHLGLGGGYESALQHAEELKISTVQIFTHSPRMFKFKELEPDRQRVLLDGWTRLNIRPVVSHASYLINIGNTDNRKFYGALSILKNELIYGKAFGCQYVVFHVGKHLDASVEDAMAQVVKGITKLEETLKETGVMLLLEIAAGQGSEFGKTFEELQQILDALPDSVHEHVGVCLDTCHMFAGGYDVGKPDAVIKNIEDTFGMDRVKVVHVNDSKFGLGEHKDRHEHIGKGHIGLKGLSAFVNHPKILDLPLILETPEDAIGHPEDLAALRSL